MKRQLSKVLIVIMILTLLPINQFTSFADSKTLEEQITVTIDKASKAVESGNVKEKEIISSENGFSIDLWHYSGGYWKYDNNNKAFYDKKYAELSKEDGTFDKNVADIRDFLTLKDKYKPTYIISKDTNIAKALDSGEEITINVRRSNLSENEDLGAWLKEDGIELDSIQKKSNGDYEITLTMDLKLNFAEPSKFNYRKIYGLNLNKQIPFVKPGYGYNMYSMWTPSGRNIGMAKGWIDLENAFKAFGKDGDTFFSYMPEGYIHPTMIRPYNKADVFGRQAEASGMLYETPPSYDEYNLVRKDESGTPIGMDGIKIKVYEEKNSARTGRILEYEPEDIRIGSNTFQGAGAVGLKFEFPITIEAYAPPKTNVIASYVKIGGIRDGKVYYEEFKPSEMILI